ncbi:MAG: LacI family DNA-binding transcriptional regulator [Candidatus Sulfotelmatobacter sp.]
MLSEKKSTVNLRTVAERVGLAPCSVSAILNNTPASHVIPQTTKDRVFRAAAELNYRPNLWARSLRTKRTRMVAAVASDFGRGTVARVVAGAQRRLHQKGYLLALSTTDFSDSSATAQFQQRGIEGVIAIDAIVAGQKELPVATVDLAHMPTMAVLTQDEQDWLAALGESAADTIIQQIEPSGASAMTNLEAKIPQARYEIPGANLGSAMTACNTA